MNDSSANMLRHTPPETSADPDIIAVGLLTLEQRLKALDRLYNEEISVLCRELAQLKEAYLRHHHSKPTRARRGNAPRAPLSRAPLEA